MRDEQWGNRPILTLADLDAYDSHEGQRRLCPLCGDGKPRDAAHRSLSFNSQNGLWKCFRCGQSGMLRDFWQPQAEVFAPRSHSRQRLRHAFDLPSLDQSGASTHLNAPSTDFEHRRQRHGHQQNQAHQQNQESSQGPYQPYQPSKTPQTTPQGALNGQEKGVQREKAVHVDWRVSWNAALTLEGTPGESYLLKRGVPLAVAEVGAVRFARSWFGHAAVVFPIKNRQGELVAAQGRGVSGSAKLTSGPKREGIFQAPALKSHSARPNDVFHPLDSTVPALILTEAPIDALSLATCGFPALALCGTSGPDWLHIVCGLRRVLMAFDADEAGDQAAIAIGHRLQSFGAKCRRLIPPYGKDWNEALLFMGQPHLTDWLTSEILLHEGKTEF